MVEQKILKTERLVLWPFEERFLTDKYVSWLNDPEVVKYSEQRHRTHDMKSCRDFVASCDGRNRLLWAIEDEKLGHVGNIDGSIDYVNGVADISILIGEKSVWGKGIGLEAFRAVMLFLFENLEMRKVTAGTMGCNEGMRSIMRKANMVEEAVRKAHYLFEGNPVDVVYAAAFKEEWPKI